MLYRNEYNQPDKAHELFLRAFRIKPDCLPLVRETAMHLIGTGHDALWLELFDTLPPELQCNARLRLCKVTALIHLDRTTEAAEILREDFVMPDVKEGELSVSTLWFELYRRIYAKENGIPYDPENAALIEAADKTYPLPEALDFRMH